MDATLAVLTWFAQVAALAAVLVGPTTAAVGVAKTLTEGRLSTRYYPALSVTVGTTLGLVVALAAPVDLSTWNIVLAGVVAGYSASALYAGAAARDAARVAASQPTPSIIGIPTVPTSPTPHPIDTYLRPMVAYGSGSGMTTGEVPPRG